jgi:hypothetical protein
MKYAAIAVFSLRVAYGAALVVAPQQVTKSWLGPAGDPTKVALRALGAREVLIHGAAIAAALRGEPLARWLAISIGGDLSDVASTFAGRAGLPGGAAPKTAIVAGGSAALSAAVLAADRAS